MSPALPLVIGVIQRLYLEVVELSGYRAKPVAGLSICSRNQPQGVTAISLHKHAGTQCFAVWPALDVGARPLEPKAI